MIKWYVDNYGYKFIILNSGVLEIFIKGKDLLKIVVIFVYCDILGLMVRFIKFNGNLIFIILGGFSILIFDGEYCIIYICDGKKYIGIIFFIFFVVYVFKDVNIKFRDIDFLEVRLDVKVFFKEDVIKFGI